MITMAIYHLSVSICSGAKGSSVVAAAAYQSGDSLYAGLDGLIKNYARKERVVHTEIFLPQFAPEKYRNRETLWNAVETKEGMRGQYARRIVIALPRELTQRQQIEAVRAMAGKLTGRGMIVDAAVHQDDHGNPHAHLLCSMRALGLNGEWLPKVRTQVVRDSEGKAICIGRDKRGRKRYKQEQHKTTDWDEVATLKTIRREWQDIANDALERAGSNARIDCRSYRDRAREDGTPEMLPTRHLGPAASAMEARGQRTEVGNYNRAVRTYNVQLIADDPRAELARIEAEKEAAQQQLHDISDARMQITAHQSLIDSLTTERNETRTKRQQLYTRCFDADGDLYAYNRPSGIFATLSGSQNQFDRDRGKALHEIDELDKRENFLNAKIDTAQRDLTHLKRNFEWINPTVTPSKTATRGKTQQRTAAPAPRKGKQAAKTR